MIKIEKLSKKYSQNVEYILNDISYEFNDTGLYFITGKSGSGKTTLLSLIATMDYEYEGSIKVDNKELRILTEKEKEIYRFEYISFSFQDYKNDENESVYSNLKKVLYITSLTAKEADDKIDFYLKKVNLLDKKYFKFKKLSGGEKKRIALVRALIKDSKILLADEPLAGLNKEYRQMVTSILIEESKRRLVIVITHEKNEIPNNSTVLNLLNGKLNEVITYHTINNLNQSQIVRSKLTLKKLFANSFSIIKSSNKLFSLSYFAILIAFFSISISFLLSTSIKNSIADSLGKYMDNNSLVITNKNSEYFTNDGKNVSYLEAHNIASEYSDYVENVYTNFITDLDDIFSDNQAITIDYQNSHYPVESLSLNDFLTYSTCSEENLDGVEYRTSNNDEIILALKENDILILGRTIIGYNYFFASDALIDLNSFLKESNISLNVKMSINDWKYDNEYSFKIIAFTISDHPKIINSSSTFSEYFVTNILHFESKHIDEKEDDDKAYTLYKIYGLRLYNDKRALFFKSMLEDKDYSTYLFKIDDSKPHYIKNNKKTFNRIKIFKGFFDNINYNSITSFVSDYSEYITGISFSSSIYTYTANSYLSGFRKPFFFSNNKAKLNEIEDNYVYSEENLEDFQASNFKVDDDVIKSDLISSSQLSSISFKSLNHKNINLLEGDIPSDYDSILISKGLKDKLYKNSSIISEKLNILSLDKSIKSGSKYENIFSQSSLKISGVVADDTLAIYHDYFFPLIYSFTSTCIDSELLFISDAIINFNLEHTSYSEIIKVVSSYDDNFKCSFPMLDMNVEISKTIKRLSMLFLSFSLVSFISSSFLMFINFYIVIKRNKKQIGIFLTIGYSKNEIIIIYLLSITLLILSAYLSSILMSFLTEKILAETLTSILNSYVSNILPYLIPLILSIIQSLIVYIFVKKHLKGTSPLDSFKNK